jgi:mono/diheme cytochrome c family protein
MPVTPRDHTDKTDPEKQMHVLSDKDIFETIKFGGAFRKKSNLMPAWGAVLSDDEINGLVKYLRKLCCEE